MNSAHTDPAQIILASASPRRYELLQQVGIRAQRQAVDIDERQRPGEAALDYVERLAIEKAERGLQVISNAQQLPVLGSDTIVVIGEQILGKPVDREDARAMLQLLSGQAHYVHTSVALCTAQQTEVATSSSEVSFRVLQAAEIDAYLGTGEADDKAGSYAIQGLAAQFISNISGSYSGIMGLPLFETLQLLKQFGITTLE